MTVDRSYRYIARNKKQVICYLDEDSISFTVQAKNQLAKAYKFRSTEIDRIHLSVSDVSWHTIDIYFRDKTHIHFKSVTFFIERDGALKRPKTNDVNTTVVPRRYPSKVFTLGVIEKSKTTFTYKHACSRMRPAPQEQRQHAGGVPKPGNQR